MTDETANGLYSLEDDYGTSYYFRGAVENNYVKFGRNSSGKDMWWRIIRFNGDGSMRMIYDGTKPYVAGEYNTDRFIAVNHYWNDIIYDAKYVGYMFGGTQGEASTSKEQAQRNETSSDIKVVIDEWYKMNIVDTGYSDYVGDEIFCNDRSIPGKDITQWREDNALGYAKNRTAFGSFGRFFIGLDSGIGKRTDIKPRLTCIQDNDKFTVEKVNGGNGTLSYPVGLITADEAVIAGTNLGTSNFFYLNRESFIWTMSPYNVTSYIKMLTLSNFGSLVGLLMDDTTEVGVAPVINIKQEYLSKMIGSWTASDPFRLKV